MRYSIATPGRSSRSCQALAVMCFLFFSPWLLAAGGAAGRIEGQVLNVANGNYLKLARVMVLDAGKETATNEYGEYQLADIPAGVHQVRVFYTGFAEMQKTVTVESGKTVRLDFQFSSEAESGVIKLDNFVVTAQRETDLRALAINEQRFAPNLKNVVSADQYGDVTEGNVGEFVKFLPGTSIDYNAADARTISVRGLPAANTPVLMDGNRLASAASSTASRVFELEQVSINNVARVEVTKVPTPDSSAEGLGGVINLVSRSAFERARPELSYRAYASANSYHMSFSKMPGSGDDPHHYIRPGFDLTYVNPVSRNFGFVVNLLSSRQYNREARSQNQWAPNNLGLAAVSGTPVTPDNPVLLRYAVQDGNKLTDRDSIGGAIDWRITPRDVVSARVTFSRYNSFFADENINWNVGTALSYNSSFTQGSTNGDVQIGTNYRNKFGCTWTPSVSWKHIGPVWKLEAGAGASRSKNAYRDMDRGFIENANFRTTNVSIRFDDVTYLQPRKITVTSTASTPTASGAGLPVDSYQLSSYNLYTVRASQNDAVDTVRSGNFNASRGFDFIVPVTLKVGADYRKNTRDIRYPQCTWTYLGPDGKQNTKDDSGGFLASPSLSAIVPPYGLAPFQWPDPYLTCNWFRAHPEYFSQVQTGTSGVIYNTANNSKSLSEEIPAGYVRVDARFFDRRLWVVTGVRYERTKDEGSGMLNDPAAIYQRDASGNFVLDAKGNKVLLTTDAVEQARLMYRERAAHAERSYDGYYPSLNMTYTVGENFIVRAGYARTIGRPDYSNIIPGTTITLPSGSNPGLIAVNNTGLKPWTADCYDLSAEYYFRQTGVLSAGVFQKDISNFFGSYRTAATAELLALYGLDAAEYADYDISYKYNTGDARVKGLEINYSHKLPAVTPWLQGFSVFGNATFLRLNGSNTADFGGFNPKIMNWGLSYARGRVTGNLKWNYNGRKRNSAITGSNITAGTYEYIHKRVMVDVDIAYSVSPRLRLFATARNIRNEPLITERYAPTTPYYARTYRFENFGVQFAFGVKGTF